MVSRESGLQEGGRIWYENRHGGGRGRGGVGCLRWSAFGCAVDAIGLSHRRRWQKDKRRDGVSDSLASSRTYANCGLTAVVWDPRVSHRRLQNVGGVTARVGATTPTTRRACSRRQCLQHLSQSTVLSLPLLPLYLSPSVTPCVSVSLCLPLSVCVNIDIHTNTHTISCA